MTNVFLPQNQFPIHHLIPGYLLAWLAIMAPFFVFSMTYRAIKFFRKRRAHSR